MSYTREEVEKKVKEIIADKLCTTVESFKDDTRIKADLGADSLDCIELVMAFEDEYDIEILDNEWHVDEMTIKEAIDRLLALVNKEKQN